MSTRYTIDFDKEALDVISKYKKSNPMVYKKLNKILNDIAEHPRTGLGHPEPLIGGGDFVYSRRITGQHRVIYEIHDDVILVMILVVEGHYNDK